jgi:hypothetical protein
MAAKVNDAKFVVRGTYQVKGDEVIARSLDGRFVTRGKTKDEASARMDQLLEGYKTLAIKHGFDPNVGPEAPQGAETWQHTAAV